MPAFRPLVALAVSLALHAAVVVLVLGKAAWTGWRMSRNVDIQLVSTKVEEVKQLPFGPPPPPPGQAPRPARRRPARAATADEGVKVASADAGSDAGDAAPASDAGDAAPASDAGADVVDASPDSGDAGADGRAPRPRDLRAYGPEGSRLTVILRIDRLRESPEAPATIAAVDALLRHLPDRRRLLDGTEMNLYQDFDALLVATPNPLDEAVTFLAARHRLSDDRLKAELARGGGVAGRTLVWTDQDGRPVGVRRRAAAGVDAGDAPVDRDDRIMVLPRPGLAVMAPPAYAALLLKSKERGTDGGAAAAGEPRWQQLIDRIDAEDGAMPEGITLMMTAANLLGSRRGRGAEGQALTGPGGLALPSYATALVGTTPAPTLEVTAEFERQADARAWEERWPALKRELLQSPLLLLSGFTGIVAKAELQREGSSVVLRTSCTTRELQRILLVIGNMIPAARGRRP